jgi:hypothetical protein
MRYINLTPKRCFYAVAIFFLCISLIPSSTQKPSADTQNPPFNKPWTPPSFVNSKQITIIPGSAAGAQPYGASNANTTDNQYTSNTGSQYYTSPSYNNNNYSNYSGDYNYSKHGRHGHKHHEQEVDYVQPKPSTTIPPQPVDNPAPPTVTPPPVQPPAPQPSDSPPPDLSQISTASAPDMGN